MTDTGLAQLGDNLINLCYSAAKSLVLGRPMGEKVSDEVLAKAIRATPLYSQIRRRTDAGTAGDAYEAIIGYLWLTGQVTVEEIINMLQERLQFESSMNRRQQTKMAAHALKELLEALSDRLPAQDDH